MWLKLLKSLRAQFMAAQGMEDVRVYVGSSYTRSEFPYIELIRGDVKEIENKNRINGGVYEFFVDLRVQNDEAESEQGYDKLHNLEALVEPALYEWFTKVQRKQGLAAIAEITGIVSDIKQPQPVYASRFTVKIKYKITGK